MNYGTLEQSQELKHEKNRLRPGTYRLNIAVFKDAQSRKKIDYAVAEMTVVDVISDQRCMYKARGATEAKEITSNPVGDRVSEMFWFDEDDDLVDLTFGRFKGFCAAVMGLDESEVDLLDEEVWDEEVEALFGRGEDAEPAVGRDVVAIVTKETVKAKTHNYAATTFESAPEA